MILTAYDSWTIKIPYSRWTHRPHRPFEKPKIHVLKYTCSTSVIASLSMNNDSDAPSIDLPVVTKRKQVKKRRRRKRQDVLSVCWKNDSDEFKRSIFHILKCATREVDATRTREWLVFLVELSAGSRQNRTAGIEIIAKCINVRGGINYSSNNSNDNNNSNNKDNNLTGNHTGDKCDEPENISVKKMFLFPKQCFQICAGAGAALSKAICLQRRGVCSVLAWP